MEEWNGRQASLDQEGWAASSCVCSPDEGKMGWYRKSRALHGLEALHTGAGVGAATANEAACRVQRASLLLIPLLKSQLLAESTQKDILKQEMIFYLETKA